jgi:hypothetical protein
MTKLSFTLALAFALNGAEKKPAPLSNTDKLRVAQAALEVSAAENDYRRLLESLQAAKTALEAKDKAFRELQNELIKLSGADGCTLNPFKQEWVNCREEREQK